MHTDEREGADCDICNGEPVRAAEVGRDDGVVIRESDADFALSAACSCAPYLNACGAAYRDTDPRRTALKIVECLRANGVNAGLHGAHPRCPVTVRMTGLGSTRHFDIFGSVNDVISLWVTHRYVGVSWSLSHNGSSHHRSVWRFAQLYRRVVDERVERASWALIR